MAREWQFDGLVGPTHNYAGLAHGNLAAETNAGAVSNPRAAALQGLEKMWFVKSLGMGQAFLPPHFRPALGQLRRMGFTGSVAQVLEQAAAYAPGLLATVYSSSFMWTANAATVTPSRDSGDGRLHLTPSNMTSHYHRAMESAFSYQLLSKIFHNRDHFMVHTPLFPQDRFGDEGAANHMMSSRKYGSDGMHFFVYGESHDRPERPARYPARQKKMASEAIARLHGIDPARTFYLQQAPAVIDEGVFHNDVIAMNTTRRMIVHARAFTPDDQARLRRFAEQQHNELVYREITDQELSVAESVQTYFFNSQLIETEQEKFVLIAPSESESHPGASALFTKLVEEGVLDQVHYRNLRESMRNGGGPACLRLRVVMTPAQEAALHPGIILTEARYTALKQWVNDNYRDRLSTEDLRDPAFVRELETAYRALEPILDLSGLYDEGVAAL